MQTYRPTSRTSPHRAGWLVAAVVLLCGSLSVTAAQVIAQPDSPLSVTPAASPSDPLAEFRITLRTEGDRVLLACEQGCAWTDLSWLVPGGAVQAVDQLGMVTPSERGRPESSDLAAFLFGVERTDGGARLVCERGCAWRELTFGCEGRACDQVIDAYGMRAQSPLRGQASASDTVYVVVEEPPELIGGLQGLQESIRYPEEARRAGVEGTVFVQFVVDEEGRVVDPVVVRSIGGGTDEAALAAVREARFVPGRQGGEAVRVRFSLPIRFRLPDAEPAPQDEQAATPTITRLDVEVTDSNLQDGVMRVHGIARFHEGGAHVAGATVHAVALLLPGARDVPPTVTAKTDANGVFTLNTPLSGEWAGVQITVYHLERRLIGSTVLRTDALP